MAVVLSQNLEESLLVSTIYNVECNTSNSNADLFQLLVLVGLLQGEEEVGKVFSSVDLIETLL